jgi:cell division protein ZapA
VVEVTISIGGHSYVLSTGEGEEDVLHKLAAIVDQRVSTARVMAGGLSEVRQLLIASLLLADELTEKGNSMLQSGSDDRAADRIDSATQRIAALAQRLDALATRSA